MSRPLHIMPRIFFQQYILIRFFMRGFDKFHTEKLLKSMDVSSNRRGLVLLRRLEAEGAMG